MPQHRAGLVLMSVVALSACAADPPTAAQASGPSLEVSIENVVGGGRAGGHAEFTVGDIRSVYTFTSITTDYPAAKGRFQLHRWFPDGRVLVTTGEVECMTIVPRETGGLARMAGRVESLRVDNEVIAVPPMQDRAIWSVLDNGEGRNSPLTWPAVS